MMNNLFLQIIYFLKWFHRLQSQLLLHSYILHHSNPKSNIMCQYFYHICYRLLYRNHFRHCYRLHHSLDQGLVHNSLNHHNNLHNHNLFHSNYHHIVNIFYKLFFDCPIHMMHHNNRLNIILDTSKNNKTLYYMKYFRSHYN